MEKGGEAVRAAAGRGRLVKFDFRRFYCRGATLPTTAERTTLLDAFDRAGRLPVRIDRSHRFRVMPRMDRANGRTRAVTLWNESAGAAPSTVVRIRKPAGAYPVWARPDRTDQPLYVVSTTNDELTVVVPELPGRQIGTVFLCDRCPETAAERLTVENEQAYLPPYAAARSIWEVGYRLRAARLWEGSANRAVLTDTVRVVAADGRLLRPSVDYRLEPEWGSIGLIGAAATDAAVNPVSISYVCRQDRLDAWYVNADGRIDSLRGEPAVARAKRPQLPKGARLLGHFWIRGGGRSDDGRFFRNEGPFVGPKPLVSAERAIPKTLAKLRGGEPVTILAWGDSVTQSSYLHRDEKWQNRLVAALKAKYPKSDIRLVTEAWGGRNTKNYLAEPSGALHNYAEKVLAVKPDLVISEFVNDGGFTADDVERVYGRLLGDFRARGIEWIALTPHYVVPGWMGLGSAANCDEDPRAYVKTLRSFAVKNSIGLADAAVRWGHLWREGIPYPTLFVNGINHPDETGMGFFVEAILGFLSR